MQPIVLTNNLVTTTEQAKKYIAVIAAVQKVEMEAATAIYLAECDFYMRAIESNPEFYTTTTESRLGVLLDVLANGLSFSPHLRYVYLEKNWVKIDSHPNKGENRMSFKTSPQGKIFLCQQAGSVELVSPPEMVYAGDKYEVVTVNGIKNIVHQRMGGKLITAGYVYVTTPNGRTQGYEMTIEEDIARLRGYSERRNKGRGANKLYTSENGQIDPGFFKAKLISHALKFYRSKPIVSSYLYDDNAEEEMGMTFPAGTPVMDDVTPPSPMVPFPTGGTAPDPFAVSAQQVPPAAYGNNNVPIGQQLTQQAFGNQIPPPPGQLVNWQDTQYAQPVQQQQQSFTMPPPAPTDLF